MLRPITLTWGFMLLALAPRAVPSPQEDLLSQAQASVPDSHHGMVLYVKHCAACHGRHGWGDGPREIPVLAGQRESYLMRQLVRFASGARAGSEMHGPVMHDTLQSPDVDRAQAFRDLASYLASAPRNPQPELGDGLALTLGARDYTRGCSGCHGRDGAGSDGGTIPAIGGQGYSYLLSRLRSFAAGHSPHAAVADSPVALSGEEQPAVADYVSRLGYLSAVGAR
jgi:cytochrome c553